MSIKVMSQVWDDSPQKGGDLLVLLALADYANGEGICWPSIPELARKSRMTERHVQKVIQRLKDAGEIELHDGGFISGRNRTNTYRVISGRGGNMPPSASDDTGGGGIESTESASDATPIEPSGNRQEEPSGTTAVETTAAAGEQSSFLPSPAPEPPKADGAIELHAAALVLHRHYVTVFGDRMRVKELTPPRERVYTKALKAVAGDLALCKRAVSGLKSYRDRNDPKKDISPSVIFETGPHSSRSLTDQIEWWATQADSGTSVDHADVPSVMRDRINQRRLTVVQMVQQPDNSSLRDRGEQALAWLKEHAKEEPVIDGDRVIEWRRLDA